jgi:hypothetical protein
VNASPSRCTVKSLLALAALCAAPALGQVYQRSDTIPVVPGGGNNPPTNLQAVVAIADGGYIAVGREATTIIHMARYDAAGTVVWSRFMPTNFDAQATSINQLGAAANPTYVVAGEIADALPWGTWTMNIDGNGNVTCPMREINGVGPLAPASRSPVAVKPLVDGSFVVTGRAQLAATAQTYGRLTRFFPGCGGVMWSMIYSPTAGIDGLTGACEITDVVEEPGDAYLLAVGTAQVANNAAVPFLLRVIKANGVVVFSKFYGNGDPNLQLRGDGLAISYDPAGAMDGYVFDGRSNPNVTGAPSPTSNYVVKVNPAGLNVMWGKVFRDFEPCHACVRTSGSNTLLAGTHITVNGTPDVRGVLVSSLVGAQIWSLDYGLGLDRGNGVDITRPTPVSPDAGPIIVGIGGTTALQTGYLVKSKIVNGTSGGCENPEPPPFQNSVELGAQFIYQPVQNLRTLEFPNLLETLRTVNACVPTHPVCCNPDYNNDGDVGTDADIADFFACLGGACCATCGSADFNCDGDVGTDADIASFFSVLAGGPC